MISVHLFSASQNAWKNARIVCFLSLDENGKPLPDINWTQMAGKKRLAADNNVGQFPGSAIPLRHSPRSSLSRDIFSLDSIAFLLFGETNKDKTLVLRDPQSSRVALNGICGGKKGFNQSGWDSGVRMRWEENRNGLVWKVSTQLRNPALIQFSPGPQINAGNFCGSMPYNIIEKGFLLIYFRCYFLWKNCHETSDTRCQELRRAENIWQMRSWNVKIIHLSFLLSHSCSHQKERTFSRKIFSQFKKNFDFYPRRKRTKWKE